MHGASQHLIKQSEYDRRLDGMTLTLQTVTTVLGDLQAQVEALKGVKVVPDEAQP